MNIKQHKSNQPVLGTMMSQKNIGTVITLITLATFFTCFMLSSKANESSKHLSTLEQRTVHEVDLNTVNISDESYKKLGLQTVPVKVESVFASKTYGGEVTIPPGGKVSISAPISGKLILLDINALKPGSKIKAGQLLYRIQPIITADARANLLNALADAESLVNTTKSQVQATEITLQRAKKLLKDLVGSQRNVDDATAAYEVSLRNWEAATAKSSALNNVNNIGTIAPIDIKSPQAGIVSNIFAAANQLVSAGSPIIEVSSLNSLWVRVPIPLGDIDIIDQNANATLHSLSAISDLSSLSAIPINAPPSADALTSSAHFYYAIENHQSTLRPAQRVSVALNLLSKSSDALTIPWSAIVFDIYGGSWVYIQKTKNTYQRSRVFLDFVKGNKAVISGGLEAGANVLANGALELFAIETGFTH